MDKAELVQSPSYEFYIFEPLIGAYQSPNTSDLRIIFLHPVEMGGRISGSALRPRMMLKSFYEKGCDVFEITGNREQRKVKFEKLKKAFRAGEKFDYLYVESLSRPTNSRISKFLGLKVLVNEKLDYEIIRSCKQQDIPIGLYLRDIHWDFKEHFEVFSPLKKVYLKTALTYFGRKEINFLRQEKIKVFTPSEAFTRYLKSKWNLKSTALPPGANVMNKEERFIDGNMLKLFYVGGVSGIYNLSVFLKGLLTASNFHCIICSRPAEHSGLKMIDTKPNFEIVEASGEELNPYFQESQIALYPLQPNGYITLAHSVKISEYIANGLPIIAFEGTHIADFIAKNNIGWVIPFKSDAVAPLIEEINANPDSYSEKQNNVLRMQEEIGWGCVVSQLERNLLI